MHLSGRNPSPQPFVTRQAGVHHLAVMCPSGPCSRVVKTSIASEAAVLPVVHAARPHRLAFGNWPTAVTAAGARNVRGDEGLPALGGRVSNFWLAPSSTSSRQMATAARQVRRPDDRAPWAVNPAFARRRLRPPPMGPRPVEN